MSVTRSTGALLGTDEAVGVSVANGAIVSGSQVDVLGDNASAGSIDVYLKFSPPSNTQGNVRVTLSQSRILGQSYGVKNYSIDAAMPNGMAYLGRFQCGRYLTVSVTNALVSGPLSNVSVLYSLEKVS